jgi:hypothetical protein
MKTLRTLFRSMTAAAGMAAFALTQATAAPVPATPAAPSLIVPVQADCYSIGQQVAAQNGGTLAGASASNRGGQTVCVIVVLVPGKEGQRPRRAQFIVPAN